MSGLAAVLAGRHAPGVLRWHAAFAPDDVAHTVTHAGWGFGHLDGVTASTKVEVLSALGRVLAFPSYYGENLDALADCLADLDRTVLLWDEWAYLARADEGAFQAVLDVLEERADDTSRPFVVLLRGDGPDLDVPSLD